MGGKHGAHVGMMIVIHLWLSVKGMTGGLWLPAIEPWLVMLKKFVVQLGFVSLI